MRSPGRFPPEAARLQGPGISSGRGRQDDSPDPGGVGTGKDYGGSPGDYGILSMARVCLHKKLRNVDMDEDLVGWADTIMCDGRVVVSVDGQDNEACEITTGLT